MITKKAKKIFLIGIQEDEKDRWWSWIKMKCRIYQPKYQLKAMEDLLNKKNHSKVNTQKNHKNTKSLEMSILNVLLNCKYFITGGILGMEDLRGNGSGMELPWEP